MFDEGICLRDGTNVIHILPLLLLLLIKVPDNILNLINYGRSMYLVMDLVSIREFLPLDEVTNNR